MATNSGSIVKNGYTYASWNTAANGSGTNYAAGATYSTDANLALFAKWTPNSYTVTFAANGGSTATPVSKSVTFNAAYGTLATTNRTNYTFNGWFTAASGGTLVTNLTSVTTAANHTLYAQWTGNPYTVTFNENGGIAASPTSKTVNFAAAYGTLATTSRTGYTFNGWFTAASGGTQVTDVTSVTATANHTLYAQWTIATYAVTYDGNNNTGGTAPPNQTKTHDIAITVSGAGTLIRSGYTFAGWNTASNGGGTSYAAADSYTANAAVTLYAQWTANTYTVSFDANGGGAPSPTTISVTYNSAYGTLATTSRAANTFMGWFTAASGGTKVDAATIVATAGDHTLYAQWVDSLTWDADGLTSGQANGGGAWLGANLWWNGVSNQAWTNGSHAVFSGPNTAGGAVTLASPTSVNAITFNTFTGTYDLGSTGQALTINGGITNNSAAGAVTLRSPITLGAAQTWTNNSSGLLTASATVDNGGNLLTIDGAGNVTMPGAVAIIGAGGLTKNGTGTLTLLNATANTWSGNTILNGGVMHVRTYGATTSTGSGNLILNGGVLEHYWDSTFTRTLGTGSGQVQLIGGASGFSQGGATLTVTLNNDAVTPLVWGSAYFNSSSLVLGANTSAGNVTFTNKINLNGSTRTIAANRPTSTIYGCTLSGVISNSAGTAGLIKTGSGLLVLSAANTYNGGTTINGGILRFNNKTTMPSSGNVTVNDDASLGINLGGTNEWTTGTSGVGTLGGLLAGSGGAGTSTMSYNGNVGLQLNVTGAQTYGGNIANVGTSLQLSIVGTGSLNLTGNNSYTGGTILSGGTLIVGSATALPGSGTLSLNGGTIQSNDSTARTFTNALSLGNNLTIGGTGNLTFSNTGALTLAADRTLTVNTGVNATFAQAFDVTGFGITKAGAGTLTLSGNSSYTGATTLNVGKLLINGSLSNTAAALNVALGATLGGTGTIGRNVTIASGGKLEFDISTNAASHNGLDISTGRSFTFSGASELTITNSGGAAPGTYTLATGGNNITGIAPATLNLPVGWAATVSISGNSLILDVTTTSVVTPGSLAINPASGLSSSGFVGGPFSPASVVYTLSNPGQTAIDWTASKTATWVTLSAPSGTLAAGASTDVTVGIGSGATALGANLYNDTVTFTNITNNTGNATRSVALTVNALPTYTVSYNANSATSGTTPTDQTKTQDLDLTLATNSGTLTRTGYTFAGWNTAANGTGTSYGVSAAYTANAAVILYAQWNEIPIVNAGTDQSVSPSGAPWTPADAGLLAWYDATDSATITQVDGAVRQWTDKVGTNHMVQTTPLKQPITDNVANQINGLNTIAFDGINHALKTDSNPFGASISNAMLMGVFNIGTINTGSTLFSLSGSSANRWQSHATWSEGTLYFDCGGINAPNRISVASGWAPNQNKLLGYYGSTTDNVQQVWVDGTNFLSDATGHTVSTASGIALGHDGTTSYDNCRMGEVIIINGTVSAGNRQKLEGYLAHKWGLAGSLPVGHPYKSLPPTNTSAVANLDGTVSDLDSVPTSAWTVVSGPGSVVFGNANAVDTTATFTVAGTYTLRLTASDPGASPTDDVVITVNTFKTTPTVNTWPTAATIVQGQALSFATLTGGSASVGGGFSYNSPSVTPAVGNYSAAVTFTPTDTINYNTVSGSANVTVLTAFNGWAGADKVFDGDANGDGVADGIAWLLSATNLGQNATALVPPATVSGNNLVVSFKYIKASKRGSAVLKLQYSNDLSAVDLWATHTVTVPETSSTDPSGVVFAITPIDGTDLNQVQATVPASAVGTAGKIFVRLTGAIP